MPTNLYVGYVRKRDVEEVTKDFSLSNWVNCGVIYCPGQGCGRCHFCGEYQECIFGQLENPVVSHHIAVFKVMGVNEII